MESISKDDGDMCLPEGEPCRYVTKEHGDACGSAVTNCVLCYVVIFDESDFDTGRRRCEDGRVGERYESIVAAARLG